MKMKVFIIPVLFFVMIAAGFTLNDQPSHDARPEQAQPVLDVAAWSIDKSHSQVGFKVRHLGISTVRGAFHDFESAISFDPNDLSTLDVSATIRVNSVSTENERRDNHLRSPDFFHAEEFPEMTFVSKGVRNIDGETFEIVGDLTIRDVTKEVVLEAEYLGTASMMNTERAGFTAETTINRMDYGLAWNNLTETGGFVVGHEVTVVLELELIKQAS